MIGQLGLVMLVVSDLDRSVAFYRDLLGLTVKYRAARWTELDAGTVSLGLHAADNELGVNPTTGCSFAFYVDDAEAAVGRLKACGTRVIQEPHREEFGAIAVISDPDGYRIQILQL